jgi:hypothetical protein
MLRRFYVLQLLRDRTCFCECASRMWIAVESWKKTRLRQGDTEESTSRRDTVQITCQHLCSTTHNCSWLITRINTHVQFAMNSPSNLLGQPFVSDQQKDVMIPMSASPLPSLSPPSSMPPSSQIPGLDLLSATQFDAEVAVRKAASSPNTPASKRAKFDTPTSSAAAPRTLLPSKIRGDCTAKVNEQCQLRRLRADYEF